MKFGVTDGDGAKNGGLGIVVYWIGGPTVSQMNPPQLQGIIAKMGPPKGKPGTACAGVVGAKTPSVTASRRNNAVIRVRMLVGEY